MNSSAPAKATLEKGTWNLATGFTLLSKQSTPVKYAIHRIIRNQPSSINLYIDGKLWSRHGAGAAPLSFEQGARIVVEARTIELQGPTGIQSSGEFVIVPEPAQKFCRTYWRQTSIPAASNISGAPIFYLQKPSFARICVSSIKPDGQGAYVQFFREKGTPIRHSNQTAAKFIPGSCVDIEASQLSVGIFGQAANTEFKAEGNAYIPCD
ncbi:MAG: hypothetical protein NXI24_17580 [bacterium]|nr:hypothetical protein [bacterium]